LRSDPLVEREVREHLACPGIEVGSAERQPPLERVGVPVVGTSHAPCEIVRCEVELTLGVGDASPSGEEVVDRLVARSVWFLRQIADRRGTRRPFDHPVDRAGGIDDAFPESLEQRRLADPVGTDDPDAITRRQLEVDTCEHRQGAASDGEIASEERGRHSNSKE
jgi:hypothetical protein